MTEAAVPVYHKFTARILVDFAVRLNLIGPLFARERLCATRIWDLSRQSVTRSSRVAALCMLNALVAILMGLDSDDIRHIFANCSASSTSIKGANAKGFWRVDQHASPELRLTILTALAFFDLESRVESERGDIKRGIEAFLAQNHGEGWMLPETADLRQDAHGEDGRENGAIVAQRLGPRIFDWQLVESGDETFCECHLHARNVLGRRKYARLLGDLIARGVAGGADFAGFLAGSVVGGLLGDSGYITVLIELRVRRVLDEEGLLRMAGTLQGSGHLSEGGYAVVVAALRARQLIDRDRYREVAERLRALQGDEWVRAQIAEHAVGSDVCVESSDEQKKLFG